MRLRQSLGLFMAMLVVSSSAGLRTSSANTITFRQGVGGYTGVQDTFLQNNLGTNGAGNAELSVRAGDDVFTTRNALLRFDEIIGGEQGQILAGTTIVNAVLELTTDNETGDGGSTFNIHRMLLDWDESTATEDLFGDGMNGRNSTDWVQADGQEAAAAASDSFVPDTAQTTYSLDVTADVQAWANGADNFGWVVLGVVDGDEVRLHSSDSLTSTTRPKLSVTTIPEPSSFFLGLAACVFVAGHTLRIVSRMRSARGT